MSVPGPGFVAVLEQAAAPAETRACTQPRPALSAALSRAAAISASSPPLAPGPLHSAPKCSERGRDCPLAALLAGRAWLTPTEQSQQAPRSHQQPPGAQSHLSAACFHQRSPSSCFPRLDLLHHAVGRRGGGILFTFCASCTSYTHNARTFHIGVCHDLHRDKVLVSTAGMQGLQVIYPTCA